MQLFSAATGQLADPEASENVEERLAAYQRLAACRTAQSELHEGSGRYREALETMRAATEADQVDRDRGTRFRAAVAALLPLAAVRTSTTERPTPFPRTGGSPAVPAERPPATGGTVAGAPTGGPGAGNRDSAGRSTPEPGFAASRPANLFKREDFPTLGLPTMATIAPIRFNFWQKYHLL